MPHESWTIGDRSREGSSTKVNVRFFASIRELAGAREETLELDEGLDVRMLLQILCKRHGQEFAQYVMDQETGLPRSHLQILMDGKSLSSLDGVRTKLTNGTEIALMPPVGGG